MRIINHKGMTLIEIIVAMAVLGIVAVSFLGIFSGSFINIMNFGRRSTAVMEANSMIDKVYERSLSTSLTSVTDVQSMVSGVISDYLKSKGISDADIPTYYKMASTITSLPTREGSESIRYFVELNNDGTIVTQSGIQGYPVYILVYYSNFKQSVTLKTFVVQGGI